MPREIIHDAAGPFDLVIRWDGDMPDSVQLGVATREGQTIAEAIGDSDNHTTVESVWTTPNRYQLNQIIRVLRRARNSSYGGDE